VDCESLFDETFVFERREGPKRGAR
jgi:hypothetical protein